MVAQDCSNSGFVIPLQKIAQENASIYIGTLAPVNLSCISHVICQCIHVFTQLPREINYGILRISYPVSKHPFLAVFVATCEHVHVPLLNFIGDHAEWQLIFVV